MAAVSSESSTHSIVWGAGMIAAGVVSGIVASALFCLAVGINFTDEGWSERGRGLTPTGVWMLVGAGGLLVIGIILFWFGMYRIANPRRVPVKGDAAQRDTGPASPAEN